MRDHGSLAKRMLTIDGINIDFESRGDGPTVLFLPGSYSTPAAWRGVQKGLPQVYRFVATSLCGYGATDETRSNDDSAIAHEVRVVEAVAGHVGGPVHLVGHSFGGTVGLAAALAGNLEILSIATFEANPLLLVRERGHAELFADMRRMSDDFGAAYHAGETDAPRRIIDYWGGEGVFATMSEAVQDYCRRTVYANVLDCDCAYRFEAGMVDYARLKMPVLLVRGALANPAMVEITAALAASLPDARSAVVDGASHFPITTHAADCARLLTEFLAEVAG
jgi:pimeloyl-ACP methyl ester carboxylesterase